MRIWSILVCMASAGCLSNIAGEEPMNGIALRPAGNKIDVSYADKSRLSGGQVLIESQDISVSRLSEKDSVYTFETESGPIDISVKKAEHASVVSFFLTPNGRGQDNGQGFVGLFFESLPEFDKGVTLWRYKPWNSWTKPIRIEKTEHIESWDVQFFYWRYSDGVYGAAIPLCGKGYRTTLGQEKGWFGAKSVSYFDDMKTGDIPQMAVGFGRDPYVLFEQLYDEGLKQMGCSENRVAGKTFPKVFESIGWCTWNATSMGHKLNEEFLLSAAKSFKDAGFPLKNVIIDDGWHDATESKLNSYYPNKKNFPNGFKPVIEKLKHDYGIADMGLWHAYNGHWQGINPESELGRKYKNDLFRWPVKIDRDKKVSEKGNSWFISPYGGAIEQFYDEFHTAIEEQGFSFLKIDNQSITERMCVGNFPVWDGARNYHRALYKSLSKHFDNTVVNCMDMTADAYYNFGTTAIGRAVEDYFPYSEGETYNLQKGNAAAHVLQAVYNSLYFSQMVYPDFDMFQSHNPNAVFHAVARAINNGPVYVTDVPGKQKFDVLFPLVFSDGRILRADKPLLPIEDCLFQVQDAKPFMAFSRDGRTGVLGAWNCADANKVEGGFRPCDVHGIEGEKFAVFEYFSRELRIAEKREFIAVSLGRLGCKLYYVVPLEESNAVIGLINKYNAPKAVLQSSVSAGRIEAQLYEGGLFAAVVRSRPASVTVDGERTDYELKGRLLLVEIPLTKGPKEKEIEISW